MTTSLDVASSSAEGPDTIICLLYVIPVVLSSAPGVNPLPISESEAQVELQKIARAHLEGHRLSAANHQGREVEERRKKVGADHCHAPEDPTGRESTGHFGPGVSDGREKPPGRL